MTAEQFAYWMQGFAELTGDEPPTAEQWESMREHLKTVFVKVTPPSDFSHLNKPYIGTPQASGNPLEWLHHQPRCSGSGSLVGAGDGDTRYA